MFVRALDRPDRSTILCEVVWMEGNQRMAIIVPVKGSIDEFPAPLRFGEGFVLYDVPTALPERIQKTAVEAAKAVAKRFLDGTR